MSDRFLNKYRIPSARASWHEYDGGAYFITICTKNRMYYFGRIAQCVNEKQMNLSEIGCIAMEIFKNVTKHYPYAEIPLFEIMPNHIHAVVIIDGGKIPYERDVETRHATSLRSEQMTNIANMQGWLSVVIGGLKSAITRYANEINIEFAWQPRFHDRIVRSQDEMNRIAEYIENNVANWQLDDLNNEKK